MRRDAGRNGSKPGSPRGFARAIAAGAPGDPAFSLGLVGVTIGLFLLLSGCSGTGRTVILSPSESNVRYSSALVTEDRSGMPVPAEVSREFRSALATFLYDRGPFFHGPELRIVYRITGYHSPGEGVSSEGKEEAGTGSVTVEVRFYNFVEKEIASIRAEGDAREAGRIDQAVRECARQVALYARQNFR